MKFEALRVQDALLITPDVFGDQRGFFFESWRQDQYREKGIGPEFVQDNHSRSTRGVLRGLHFQLNRPQGKLVRCVVGEIFDVIVDLRRSSPTFGRWHAVTLSAENHQMLWVPPGMAHGFQVTSEVAEMVYKCTEYYAPEDEYSLLWNDPELAIEWPMPEMALLSDKDLAGNTIASSPTFA